MGKQVLFVFGLVSLLMTSASGQVSTTQIADTIYRADGSLATGTVIISWSAFTSASGQSVPGGSTSAPIAVGGSFHVSLAPNAGAIPQGSFYTAVYHLDNGSVSREYWVVPVSQSAVTVSSIRSAVLPASVAMQTASKSYVDTQIAAAITGHVGTGILPYVDKSGDTMSGPLALAGDPTSAAQAASKHYVDTVVGAVNSGLLQKVSTAPQTSQVIAQPSGTQMQTNLLNGVEYASQSTGGFGGNGIANATLAPDCANGCEVKAEQSYGATEGYTPATWNFGLLSGTHVVDDRGGQRHDSYLNPVNLLSSGNDSGQIIDVVSTRRTSDVSLRTHAEEIASLGLVVNHSALTGGSNLFPASIENPVPYFKTGYSALGVNGVYNSAGEHVLEPRSLDCFGVGDCLMGSQFLRASGGFRDEADEGAHPFDLQFQEDTRVFQGSCSAGCTIGLDDGGNRGDRRWRDAGRGSICDRQESCQSDLHGSADRRSDCGCGCSWTDGELPGDVVSCERFSGDSSGDPLPGEQYCAGGCDGWYCDKRSVCGIREEYRGTAEPIWRCVCHDLPNAFNPTNYEMARYTVVDGTHLQLTLNKAHAAGTTIAVGGLCGYGAEQTVDTLNGIRQVFPVIESYSATGLYYARHLTPVLGISGQTSAYLNMTLPIAAISRRNNTVTVTVSGTMPIDGNGLTLTVDGVADASFNGSFPVTSTGASSLTYTQAGGDAGSSGRSIGVLTGAYALYPMAEVLGVFDATTESVDGQLTLAANTVPWGQNDAVEEPHYFQEAVQADTEFFGQTSPRPTTFQRGGSELQINVGPGQLDGAFRTPHRQIAILAMAGRIVRRMSRMSRSASGNGRWRCKQASSVCSRFIATHTAVDDELRVRSVQP